MKMISGTLLLLFIFFVSIAYAQRELPPPLPLRGINLAGAEFAGHVLPGKHGVEYLFPSEDDINMYADFGMQVIRLPFRWERLQPKLGGPFDKEYLGHIDSVVEHAEKRGVMVVLDVHNYGKYRKEPIGSDSVPVSAFAELWSTLANRYKERHGVLFGLMNEPIAQDAGRWATIAQTAVTAIRNAGAKQIILIPGTYYSAAHKWLKKDGSLSNGEALQTIRDPLNNIVFEAHVYLDSDSSGTHFECVDETIGVKRLEPFTNWLKDNKFRGFLGEFGASKDPVCLAALENILAYMDQNADVWFGWAFWAASERFGDYMFNIYPPDTEKFPQARILQTRILSVPQKTN